MLTAEIPRNHAHGLVAHILVLNSSHISKYKTYQIRTDVMHDKEGTVGF